MSFFYCRSITEIENEPKRASPLDKMGWTVVLRVYWPLARCCTWTIFSSWYRRTIDHSNDRVRAERFGRSSPLMLFQTVFHFHPIRWAKFPNNVGHHQCNHKCWHIPRGILSVRSSWPLSRDWWLSGITIQLHIRRPFQVSIPTVNGIGAISLALYTSGLKCSFLLSENSIKNMRSGTPTCGAAMPTKR